MIYLVLLSLCVLIHIYIGYPIAIYVYGTIRNIKINLDEIEPTITVIIAAYNEEKYIKEKIINALSLDYPKEKLEVIVVSDGSDDDTYSIAQSVKSKNLILIEQQRSGKPTALNNAIKKASGELIFFTDANVFFSPNSLKELVLSMGDKKVGAVTGKVDLVAIETTEPLGEGAYMRYERFLQKYETLAGTVVGTDGGMFLARRSLIKKLPENIILDDFYIVMNIILQGYRVVYDEKAHAKELVPASVEQEFRRKTRIAAGGFQVLAALKDLLFYPKNISFMFQLYSHKILRWLSPVFLLMLYLCSIPMLDIFSIRLFFLLQNGFYFLAVIGMLSSRARKFGPIYISYYFCAINVALLFGLIKAITNSQKVTWDRVER